MGKCTIANKRIVEGVDRTLKEIWDNNNSFCGITIVLSEDFRQTFPVICKGIGAY